ncbi:MAG: bacteriophage CI repressor [Crenarchaeota archaeon]|jgi:hypothetical protein|nr:bacteriophage CI repressor [Thermoproteota archaeon]
MNNFNEILNRLKTALNVDKDADVAKLLGLTNKAFSLRKGRNSFPDENLRDLVRREPWREIDLEFILTGELSEFEQINRRFKSATGLKTDLDVIAALEITSDNFIKGRLDNLYPIADIFKYANKYAQSGPYKAIDADYVITGKTVTVEQYGIHLIGMLEKLAELPAEDQLSIIQQVNKLYSLRQTIKSLQDDKKQ